MKKSLTIITSSFILLFCVSCGSNSGLLTSETENNSAAPNLSYDAKLSSVPSTTTDNSASDSISEISASWADDDTPFEIEEDTSKLTISDKVEIKQSKSGYYVLVMNFTYTNMSNEARNFINDYNVSVDPYQNGIELDTPGFTAEDGVFDTNNSYTKIKNGASIDAQRVFVLRDTSSPIEVEIGNYSDYSKKIIKTITINE